MRHAGPRQSDVAADEADREHVRERELAAEVPVHLLEGAAEERRQEEEGGEPSSWAPLHRQDQVGKLLDAGSPGELRLPRGRERLTGERPRPPAVAHARRARARSRRCRRERRRSRHRSPEQRGGRAVGRHERKDRAFCGQVLEDLAREHAPPAAVGLGDQEQERLGVALELRAPGGGVRTGSARSGP